MSRTRWVAVVALLAALVLSSTGLAKVVFVDRISGYDSQLVNLAPQYLAQWIRGMGHQQTNNRANADYIVRLMIVTADAERPFNLWFLAFFICWPFARPRLSKQM